jgi:uncharacterized protein YcaQ
MASTRETYLRVRLTRAELRAWKKHAKTAREFNGNVSEFVRTTANRAVVRAVKANAVGASL